MNNEDVRRENYDVVLITRPNKAKRSSYVQDATIIGKSQLPATPFLDILANKLKTVTVSDKCYF
ncbi:hypothetical protein A3K48_06020 [candidate division WOR-1 bacterium RIFOXYA12_FULL_52_29]|uniref:Uncharacterized protein n=1 Tax=candidate division WOR-1 bacterium RIFOXYC12_FULL_54_18 TaxID=1802584 RepID=A0A1F4T7B4_UNCSA|nr:MAG: hypothetical protein A3K44_06020 [candidate division WOR-1 bacterium RIFOXYA2_FULL_51_19]OGC18089.1 MAG: hypothetical protein A3K48_06020 [candidate division WOR-1 bacterium RIFOXYA12_FULL_52_29]OGC26945.1 MAG: hypothetical protein A3K32_06015 [candidate division WOR-1 bacterium RIFOXYB2_FULL_45_9]OGC28506.1 MAG: hypothetical protein A3K49_06020 [candidate division WOR-1 bacterium RIFOXYC12_FULL_54_18]OGC31039.1 MAG: hypothetical protein A2346_06600 [candidate division WOR-1 bacterium R